MATTTVTSKKKNYNQRKKIITNTSTTTALVEVAHTITDLKTHTITDLMRPTSIFELPLSTSSATCSNQSV